MLFEELRGAISYSTLDVAGSATLIDIVLLHLQDYYSIELDWMFN